MAARRLLIVMLILLGLSTLAAALVPQQAIRDESTGSTAVSEENETTPPDTVPEGRPFTAKVKVGGRTKVVPIKLGDQLDLVVLSKRAGLLEIPRLGLVEPVSPDAPARFNILAEETGSYGIRLVEADRVVARIEVSKRKAASPSGGG